MEQLKTNTKLSKAESTPNFWIEWQGTPESSLAMLTNDIYAYEVENNLYGKGIGIKYGNKKFWYSPEYKTLVNSANEKITAEELRNTDNGVIAEQINRLIEMTLSKKEERQ